MMHVQRFVVWRHGWLSVFSKPNILGIIDGTSIWTRKLWNLLFKITQ